MPFPPRSRRTGELPLSVAAALLVASSVTWRQNTFYSGGLDPVVVGKAVLSVTALTLAVGAARRSLPRRPLRLGSMALLALLLVASIFGAWYTQSTLSSSLTLVARLVVLAVTVFELLRAFPPIRVIRALAIWMAVIGLVAAVTGLGTLAAQGRLSGGIPPLFANELAELCGFALITLIWRDVQHRGRLWDFPVIVALAGITYLTGSRTGLLALGAALVVLFVQVRRLPVGVVLATLPLVPGLVFVVFGTHVVSDYLGRGGSTSLTTLSSRTVAWSSALHLHHAFWDTWFGSGLSQLEIPVAAKYRSMQVLDSSWISALVQGGLIGIILLAVWACYVTAVAVTAPRPYRLLATTLVVFTLARSFLESGLVAASPAYLILLVVSLSSAAPTAGASRPAEPDRPAGKRREAVLAT
ncbi:MAG: O-antigen ligase family protein [Jatrophihabitantaceae bacterium]